MNLKMIRPKNATADLLLSLTENCETLIKQTHRKAEETVEFKLAKLREIFSFKPPIQIEGSWLIGLRSLEVYNSFLILREKTKSSDFINFLIQRVVAIHMKDSEMRLKKTGKLQILQLLIYKMR